MGSGGALSDKGRQVNLSGYTFSEEVSHQLKLRLNSSECPTTMKLASDGQQIRHVLNFEGEGDGGTETLKSRVTIITLVEAVPSCSRSSARLTRLSGDLTPSTPQLNVEIRLVDVDGACVFVRAWACERCYTASCAGLPIGVSMPRTTITWTSAAQDVLSFAPTRPKGADSLSGEIPSSRRSDPGVYQLVVILEEGWNEATGNETACVILSETVTIASTQTQLVVAVVLSVIFVLVVAALAYVLYRNRQRFKAVLFSLISLELMLTLEILSVRLVVCRTIYLAAVRSAPALRVAISWRCFLSPACLHRRSGVIANITPGCPLPAGLGRLVSCWARKSPALRMPAPPA